MVRFRSAESPFDAAGPAGEAARLLCRAEASGLWNPTEVVTRLDGNLFGQALGEIAGYGVASARVLEWPTFADKGPDELAGWVGAIRAELDACPVPEREIEKLEAVLGAAELVTLLGISVSAFQRYRRSERDIPDAVAWRAHVLAGMVGDLAGSYNDVGIRGWFRRGRSQLGDRAPSSILSGAWDPDSDDVLLVRDLAGSLVG